MKKNFDLKKKQQNDIKIYLFRRMKPINLKKAKKFRTFLAAKNSLLVTKHVTFYKRY